MWRSWSPCALRVGMRSGAATTENSMQAPQRLETEPSREPAPTPGATPGPMPSSTPRSTPRSTPGSTPAPHTRLHAWRHAPRHARPYARLHAWHTCRELRAAWQRDICTRRAPQSCPQQPVSGSDARRQRMDGQAKYGSYREWHVIQSQHGRKSCHTPQHGWTLRTLP